jgi:two-component system cell cycle sensor histidine kinase/response regulator CckA
MKRTLALTSHSEGRRTTLLITCLFAVIIACLLLVANIGMEILSATRSYVGGEGLWSKGQKDALFYLMRYADTGDERDYARYRAAIAVPLGDRRAREELERPAPDLAAVTEGFLAGRNHPDDIPGMIRLFRRFRSISYIDRAIAIWAEADGEIARVEALAAELRDSVAAGDRARRVQILAELDAANRRLTALEDTFSLTLGEAARWVQSLVLATTLLTGGLLLGVGVLVSRQLVARIAASEEKYRLLMAHASDGILVMDAQGRLAEANNRAAELLGYAPAELQGMRFEDLIEPDDLAAAPIAYDALRAGQTLVQERRLRRRDGERIIGEISARFLAGAYIQAIIRDVTERRNLEAQLRQAQKMESIGRLAGGIAHDFNNVLTAIGGYARLALEQTPPTSPLHADLEEIVRATERASSLTRQLLSFSRKQIFRPQVLDVNTLIRSLENMLHRLIGSDILLELRLAADLTPVRADSGQLEQLLVNLVVNARDAMPKGGRLEIATANQTVTSAEARPFAGLIPGRYAVITVTDTGVGMSDEVRQHLFEPFFTTKEPGRGTGLGLATCYGIVRQHSGYITCRSEPGQGTAFTIYLPQANEAPTATPSPLAPGRLPRGDETVLLVEDEPAVRALARRLLRKQGYTVLEAEHGAAALELARQQPGRQIDLLITDIVMPHVSGLELVERLTAERPTLKVLLMSGYNDSHGIEAALGSGRALITKPFTPEALARRVREVLDGEVQHAAF